MEVYIAIEFGQVSQVVHKHELHRLTMTRTLSKAIYRFLLLGMLAITCIQEYFNCCHLFYFLLSNLSKSLHVAFLLLVSIVHVYAFTRVLEYNYHKSSCGKSL